MLTTLGSWNDFLWPLIVTNNENSMSLSVDLRILIDARLKSNPFLQGASADRFSFDDVGIL